MMTWLRRSPTEQDSPVDEVLNILLSLVMLFTPPAGIEGPILEDAAAAARVRARLVGVLDRYILALYPEEAASRMRGGMGAANAVQRFNDVRERRRRMAVRCACHQ